MSAAEKVISNEVGREEVRRCVRCIMPENYPAITFDAQGVCNYCRYFDSTWGSWVASAQEQARSEARLRRIFESAKRKHKPYDALVGISGGKDSSYMLYLCHKVYGLRVLAFTRDNGFMSDGSKVRIERLVKALDVKHLYCREPLTEELAGVFMRKTGNFCAPCELLSFNTHAVVAREHDIPLILVGSSSRTEAPAPKYLNPWDPWYFQNVLKGEQYRERLRCSFFSRNYLMGEAIAHVFGHRRIVVLPEYIDWDEAKISALFEREFGFVFGQEHSDCWASDVARYLYSKKCNGVDPLVAKYSLLIRSGKMTRVDAIEKLSKIENNVLPLNLDRFLKVTGMTLQEFEAASERSPTIYLTGLPLLFNTLRRKVRRQVA